MCDSTQKPYDTTGSAQKNVSFENLLGLSSNLANNPVAPSHPHISWGADVDESDGGLGEFVCLYRKMPEDKCTFQ